MERDRGVHILKSWTRATRPEQLFFVKRIVTRWYNCIGIYDAFLKLLFIALHKDYFITICFIYTHTHMAAISLGSRIERNPDQEPLTSDAYNSMAIFHVVCLSVSFLSEHRSGECL